MGRVVPAAAEPVVLKAEAGTGEVEGQSAVARTAGIQRVSIVPADAAASAPALEALARPTRSSSGRVRCSRASWPRAAVPGIAAAISRRPGRRVYVANLRPQPAETEGFDVAAHVDALLAHGVAVDVVVADFVGIALGRPGRPGGRCWPWPGPTAWPTIRAGDPRLAIGPGRACLVG